MTSSTLQKIINKELPRNTILQSAENIFFNLLTTTDLLNYLTKVLYFITLTSVGPYSL